MSFGVAMLLHLPVMNPWKKLMDIQKPLAGVTRCATHLGHLETHFQMAKRKMFRNCLLREGEGTLQERTPPTLLQIQRSDMLQGEGLEGLVSKSDFFYCTHLLYLGTDHHPVQNIHFHWLFQAILANQIKEDGEGWCG